MSEPIRGFHWSNKARYAAIIPTKEVMFGLYYKEGGMRGEMAIRWVELDGKEYPKLECYSESFSVLFSFPDLLDEISSMPETFTDSQFVATLHRLGFEDMTSYPETVATK